MYPDRVSNPGPLTYESGALPIALGGPAPRPWIRFAVVRVEWEHNSCTTVVIPTFPLSQLERVVMRIET